MNDAFHELAQIIWRQTGDLGVDMELNAIRYEDLAADLYFAGA